MATKAERGAGYSLRFVTAWSVEQALEKEVPRALLADVTLRDADGSLWSARHRLHLGTLWESCIANVAWYSNGLLPTDDFLPGRPDELRNGESRHHLVGPFETLIDDRSDSYITVIGCDPKVAGVTQLFQLRMKLFGVQIRIDEIIGLDRRGRSYARHIVHLETRTNADSLLTLRPSGPAKVGGRRLEELSPFVLRSTLTSITSSPLETSFRRMSDPEWRASVCTSRWSEADLDRALAPNAIRFRPFERV